MKDKSKYLGQLKEIKKDLNIDWFVLTEENSKDSSKCSYAILVDNNYYKTYIGEVGRLVEKSGYAIKIKKTEFLKLFKEKSSAENVYELLKLYISDEDENEDTGDFKVEELQIDDNSINKDDKEIIINYGDEHNQGYSYGRIVIKEVTLNYLKQYGYSKEMID